MKQKKTIISLLSIFTFATILTACGATTASGLTPPPSAQVMSASNTISKAFDHSSTEQLVAANNAIVLTSTDNESNIVQDVLLGGDGSAPLEFWEISEYENWIKTEHEKNQKLADSGELSFYTKDDNDNYICRAWTQADVDLLYEQWQEQLSLMKQGYHFTKEITLPDGGLLAGAFDPETWNAKSSVALGSTIITMPDKSTVDLGHFDTADEATKAVSDFLKKQVEQGNLTQKQADKILSNGAVE